MRVYITKLSQWFNPLKTISADLEINCRPVHGLIHGGTQSKTENFFPYYSLNGMGPGNSKYRINRLLYNLFLDDFDFQPLWQMMSLSGIPIAAERLAPPERRLCRPYCCGSKEIALSCLRTSSGDLV